MSINRSTNSRAIKRRVTHRIKTHKPTLLRKGGSIMQTQVQPVELKPDNDYLNEVMKELGIDTTKKRKSRFPRSRLGLPVIRGAGRTMLEMYEEEHGKC